MSARGVAFVLVLLVPPGAAWPAPVESTCITCHAEEEDEELSAPVEEWRRSVHAAADVSCDACHGGDPFEEDEDLSMDEDAAGFLGAPGWEEVPEFCGTCHESILDGYSQSVMAQKIAEGEEVAVCTTCHMTNGHDIEPAVASQILTEERCGECHDAERAVVLRDLLEDLERSLAPPRRTAEALRRQIDLSSVDAELEDIRHRAVVIAHTYDRDRIEELALYARGRLEGIEPRLEALAAEVDYRRRLGFAVVGVLSTAFLAAVGLRLEIGRSRRD